MSSIVRVSGIEILDSRGNPTVEAEVFLADGSIGRAAVPSGASTGEHEAVELRDGDKSRYLGKGTLKAVANINGPIAKALHGHDATLQAEIDRHHDRARRHAQQSPTSAPTPFSPSPWRLRAPPPRRTSTPLYRYLGGVNACTLPVPMMNIINGGAHADNSVDMQEFMIVPYGATQVLRIAAHGRRSLPHAERRAQEEGLLHRGRRRRRFRAQPEVQRRSPRSRAGSHHAKPATSPASRSASRSIPPPANSSKTASTSSRSPIRASAPASRWWNSGPTGCASIPIISIEDGMAEDDWDGWKLLTDTLGNKIQLVGDDLFVTNTERLKRGIEKGIANSILIKVNQIGTLTETLEAMQMASKDGYTAVVSHRSGETEDPFIADLAVATSAGQIKTGSASRTDRIAKYNQLLRIEERLGAAAKFPGRKAFRQ